MSLDILIKPKGSNYKMKAKKLVTLTLAAAMVAASSVSVFAAELTDTDSTGQTEVKAHISGNAGNVSYIITIPDVIDFGELTQPEDNSTDHFKDVNYEVKATKIVGLDDQTQNINVYVRDQNASVGGVDDFFITNKNNANLSFEYSVFNTPDPTNNSALNDTNMPQAVGYHLHSFDTEGDTMTGVLRFNQNNIYGYDITQIAGDYSGYMVFFSTIENK